MDEKQTAAQDQQADDPTDVSASGWWDIAKQTWKEAGEDNLGLVASGVAFYAFLAFVPLLTAVVLSYGLMASPAQVADHIATMSQTMPQQVAELIGGQLQSMVETASSTVGIGLAISIGLAVYGATRGASAIVIALNIVYDVEESRSFIWQTISAFAITLGLVLAFILGSLAISAMTFVESLVPDLGGVVHFLLQAGFWLLAAVGVSFVVAVIYRYAPNRPEAKWRWLTPGSAVATLVWIAATLGFAFYVSNFGSYNETYGSLGAVIVFLTWLYLSGYIVLLGGELNQVLERRVGREKTLGSEGEAAKAEALTGSRKDAAADSKSQAGPRRAAGSGAAGARAGADARPADPDAPPSLAGVLAKLGGFALMLKLLPRRSAAR